MPGFAAVFHWMFAGILLLVELVIAAVAAWYVYSDSSKRYPEDSPAPIVWAVVVFFAFLAGFVPGLVLLVLYLVVRPPRRRL